MMMMIGQSLVLVLFVFYLPRVDRDPDICPYETPVWAYAYHGRSLVSTIGQSLCVTTAMQRRLREDDPNRRRQEPPTLLMLWQQEVVLS